MVGRCASPALAGSGTRAKTLFGDPENRPQTALQKRRQTFGRRDMARDQLPGPDFRLFSGAENSHRISPYSTQQLAALARRRRMAFMPAPSKPKEISMNRS